ncbi:MAG: hypothetical protein KDA20_11740 [Phycisphaerales bacterium]|nr:hypothetical protein [Phycisphaerales bacterium]
MLDTLQAGDTVTFTVKRNLPDGDVRQTVARLMRNDPAIKKTLRNAQEHRRRTTPTHIRGGRVWVDRPRATKAAIPVKGATWTMTWTPILRKDVESVAHVLDVKK